MIPGTPVHHEEACERSWGRTFDLPGGRCRKRRSPSRGRSAGRARPRFPSSRRASATAAFGHRLGGAI
jgi:hypothetical protein